jgi:hypothetical protein
MSDGLVLRIVDSTHTTLTAREHKSTGALGPGRTRGVLPVLMIISVISPVGAADWWARPFIRASVRRHTREPDDARPSSEHGGDWRPCCTLYPVRTGESPFFKIRRHVPGKRENEIGTEPRGVIRSFRYGTRALCVCASATLQRDRRKCKCVRRAGFSERVRLCSFKESYYVSTVQYQ